jgi:hypothetical protein
VAGTGTLWPGGVVSESSLGRGQTGAEASRVREEGTKMLSRGSEVDRVPDMKDQD